MTAPHKPVRRIAPALPGWQRLGLLTAVLMIGGAFLLPAGTRPQWWHLAIAAVITLVFLGSWHGQHWSTALQRWTPMTYRNRRARRPGHKPKTGQSADKSSEPRKHRRAEEPAGAPDLSASTITVHIRPQPHGLITAGDSSSQLPWPFVMSWLQRYGLHADILTAGSVRTTPPGSALRQDVDRLLTGYTSQHEDTWISYTLTTGSNLEALAARGTDIATVAATTARRLIAELREKGWLATLVDDPKNQLPQFVHPDAAVRRECWTGTEYVDGFRAVYTINPQALSATLAALPSLPTKSTWIAVTIRAPGHQAPTIEAVAATWVASRPDRVPLPGLDGCHGRHRQMAEVMSVDDSLSGDVPRQLLEDLDLSTLRWPTAAAGVPIGSNRAMETKYLGLASPEPVRITIAGEPAFQVSMCARLALSGLPMAIYSPRWQMWQPLANHAATEQFAHMPVRPAPGAIVVDDGIGEVPAAHTSVMLRAPGESFARTTITIEQDRQRPTLFSITTPKGSELLTTQMSN
ncbi:Protein of uncharacterised function (DUF2984) [Mycobacteroides abscessus subsp. abscessus]|uniref:type VII secretion protein EccE n=1 Tax=Mycobacteroides abscessus TaxID=36809 RepID=UPI000929BA3F|nr:type VII secretion protein EccE [Mycobacteroides abscessus]SIJ22053.1 Protein of uncharacterised function (DUF2984) [Mycobacteroides abscessus subsp. abscessus]SLH38600.1 Protein of uncharacterised function (DUF2984) [Mycobacteroides abscessus subsp. abscessus]